MPDNPFVFDSVIYNGIDLPRDGIGNHLRLFDRNIFHRLPADRKSLSSLPGPSPQHPYGKVRTDLHLNRPNRFKNCLFFDIARDTWEPEMVKAQMVKTIEHKRMFNAVTGIYLMWESDRLWDLYGDLVDCYDFCVVTSSILDDYLAARGVDFVRLRHPYDFALPVSDPQPSDGDRTIRFGVSAGLWPRKNVSLLAREFARIFRDDPGVELSIHTRSDVNHPDFVEEYRLLRQVQEEFARIEIINISFSRSHFLQWLKSVDVYCFLSSGEGYSVTPREALHLKIPVLLHDAHVHKEFSHLPGVVRVASLGAQTAAPNTSKSGFDVGNQWQVDLSALEPALLECRHKHQALKSDLVRGYEEVLRFHELHSIRAEWVEVLNEKYGHYIDLVRLDYPDTVDTPVRTVPRIPGNLKLAPPFFKNNTGKFVRGRVYCLRSEHEPGHCLYGPDVSVTDDEEITVIFRIDILSKERPETLVNLDVYDNANDALLAIKTIGSRDGLETENEFSLTLTARPHQVLEFRVYWLGTSDLCVSGVEVRTAP